MKRACSILLAAALMLLLLIGCGTTEASVTEVKVTLPNPTGASALVEGEAVITTQLYLLSRAYCEKLAAVDTENFDAQAYIQLVAESAEAFRITEAFCDDLEERAGILAELEESGTLPRETATYQVLSASAGNARHSALATPAYAAEEKSPAVQYAEEITRAFDNAQNGQKLKTLAQQYGTDVKHAKAMLEQAQAVLEGSAYEDQAAVENDCYQLAVETKAAASTIGFGLAVITSGGIAAGGASAAGIIEAGGIVCGGLQAVIDTGIAASIHTTNGEGNEDTVFYEKADEALSPISSFFAIGGGVKNIKDFRDPAEAAKKFENAAQAWLTGIGFVRDYVQDDKVLGVSANMIDGCREIIFREADVSDSEAVEEVLTKTGVSPEVLEAAENASGTPEQTEGFGTAADSYIEEFSDIIDPDNPMDAEAVFDAVDEAFAAYAPAEESVTETETETETETATETTAETETETETTTEAETETELEDATKTEPEEAAETTETESETESETVSEKTEETESETAVSEDENPLSAANVAGTYPFEGWDSVIEGFSGADYAIEAIDDSHLKVTEVAYGESISGEYDEATGIFTADLGSIISQRVTIVFTDTEEGIRADYEMSLSGSVTSSMSAVKEESAKKAALPASEVAGTYEFTGETGEWAQIITVVDDMHLTVTDAEDPEAAIIGSYDENTGIFSYTEGGEGYYGSIVITFTDTGSGIRGNMVFTINDVQASWSAIKE